MNEMKRSFPNISTLGEYNCINQLMYLSEIDRDNFTKIVNDTSTYSNVNNLSVILHEVNHYMDHIGTLFFGAKMIRDLSNASNALYNGNQREDSMWKVMKFYRTINDVSISDYYRNINQPLQHTDNRRWSFSLTYGKRFDANGYINHNNPIIFSKFEFDGIPIARIPFSVSSMLEANSISSELECKLRYLWSVEDNVTRLIDDKGIVKEYRNIIYNTDLLEYSHIVHTVSTYLVKNGNLFVTYKIVQLLATLSMNLPTDYFDVVRIPTLVGDMMSTNDINAFLSNRDATFIYICLCNNLIENDVIFDVDNFDIEDVMRLILKVAGLPSLDELTEKAKNEFETIINSFDVGPITKNFTNVVKSGKDIFNSRGLFSQNNIFPNGYGILHTMPIICCDEIMDHKYLDRESDMATIESLIIEFVRGCGILP